MESSPRRRPIIAPSILTADFAHLAKEVSKLDAAVAEWLHLDVTDGVFVPNMSFGADVVQELRPHSRAAFDVHLMIADPAASIRRFAAAGADRITVHLEGNIHIHRVLGMIHAEGLMAGVALNPRTPVNALDALMGVVDQVLVMSVDPGFGGQRFVDGSIDKVAKLRALRGGLKFLIGVDGGINPDNAAELVRAGADVLVAGSAIFQGAATYAENITALHSNVVSCAHYV